MLSGNIHLSSDLRRLAFVRLYVYLTSPRSKSSKEALITKYRRIVQGHRDAYNWNLHPTKGLMAGTGIGATPESKTKQKRSSETDVIALNHLTLAKNLEFLKSEECSWAKNAYVLASISADELGIPTFLNKEILEKKLQEQGFIAILAKSEQFIFASSLLELDVDRIIPLLLSFERESTGRELEDQFLPYTYKWLEMKILLESSNSSKYRLKIEQKSIKDKIARLEKEKSLSKTEYVRNRNTPSVKTYCTEQVSPRLHFLQDLGYIKKIKLKYSLTDEGQRLRQIFAGSFPEIQKNAQAYPLENEQTLLKALIDVTSVDLKIMDFETFETAFLKTARFYKRSGALLQNYFSTLKSIAAIALEDSKKLSIELFDSYLTRLAEDDRVTISTSGRGTKYIRIRDHL